jgi:hypothetical protein
MNPRALLVGVALAAGFASSLVAAAMPEKHGPPTTGSASTSTATTTSKGKKPPKTGLGCRPSVALVLKGTLVSKAASSFEMSVIRSNRHALAHRGAEATVNVDGKTKIVRQGPSTLSQLSVGDRLNVQARACMAERDAAVLLATRVVAQPAKAITDTTSTTGEN